MREAAARAVSVLRRRSVLWPAFLGVHAWLAAVNIADPTLSLPDVTVVYRHWAEQGLIFGHWLGIDGPWVYPVVALAPMLLTTAVGPALEVPVWLLLVTALDAAVLALLTGPRSRPGGVAAGWWWTAFLLLLGPIAVTRIDALTVPPVIAALWLASSRPAVAGALAAVAGWLKVWPFAIVAALTAAARRPARAAGGALLVTGAVLVTALLLGSGPNVLSFLWVQSGRGLQIEAPLATPWLWAALLEGESGIYYDREILTFQLDAHGVSEVLPLVTPLLAVAVLALLAVALLARRRGVGPEELLPPLALAVVVALLTLNKVGSPQLALSLAAPVILGLSRPGFRFPALCSLAIAVLTQAVYPFGYDQLLALQPGMLAVLTLRNILYAVLLAWAVVRLVRLAGGSGSVGRSTAPGEGTRSSAPAGKGG